MTEQISSNELLCPICIQNKAEIFTECNHSYCIQCLCRIKKCAMCRKTLLRAELCEEIKHRFEKKSVFDNEMQRIERQSHDYFDWDDQQSEVVSYFGQFPNTPSLQTRNNVGRGQWINEPFQQHQLTRIDALFASHSLSVWQDGL